ncbi:MAG: S8 family serine peptidase [Planctomycetes bacterium]|nr:S8 family serine peptidase [Planctomycetota bacterium]
MKLGTGMKLGVVSIGALALATAGVVAQQRPRAPEARPGQPAAFDLSREHKPGKVVYRMAVDGDSTPRRALEESVGALRGKEIFDGLLYEMELAPGADLGAALAKLNADPRVKYAQPSWIYRIDNTPNDPSFSAQWGWDQANDADIDAPEAWDTATDATAALVAVIDTGVEYTHPDLAANMWVNPGEIAANGIDDDGNGWIDDVHGVDTVNNDGDPMDDHFHGTHCAGTIGAHSNNGVGVTGACWNARIMAIKFLDAGGSGDTADAVEAIDYAVDMEAHVTSNSWGGYGTDQALYDAIDASGDCGQLFCAAAGNSAINIEGQFWLPGGFDLDEILCVAATNSGDGLAWFSNYGAVSVDVGAPGDSIYSTFIGSSYAYLSGTSMATPHVAGVATMLFAQSGYRDGQAVKQWIMDSVDPIPALAGITVTGGRLNFDKALDEIPAAPTLPSSGILFSLRKHTTIGAQTMFRWDVWHLDPVTGIYTIVYDGLDVQAAPTNIDAVCALPDGSLLMSFNQTTTMVCLFGGPNGNVVDEQDVVRFVPYSYGSTTFGHFEFYLDGSDVGLDTVDEDIDGLALDGAGNLLISTQGKFSVPGLAGFNEDVVLFAPSALGKDSAGTFSMFLRGQDTDVRLGQNTENVDAIDFDLATSTLFLSTDGNFQVPFNQFGQNDDILEFVGSAWGSNPAGTFTIGFDGAPYGLDPHDTDALDILP